MKSQILACLLAALLAVAHPQTPPPQDLTPQGASPALELPATPSQRAVIDLQLACSWLAESYEIPLRVPQEILLAGYSYSDAMIALSLMHKGASLNELLELRRHLRWPEVARRVEVDPNTLPLAVRYLLQLGVTPSQPKLLHFLPDVYSGMRRDLTINAFPPTLPTQTMVKRFRLDEQEVSNIRRALDDPFGVPEALLNETAGKGALVVGDWVMAGVLAHHRPLPMEAILGARGGQQLSWSEICLAFGMRPDVLTRGPLTGIYPVLTGSTPGTILCARPCSPWPQEMPLRYEHQRLTADEKLALRPLMLRALRAQASEDRQLQATGWPLLQQSIALQLARLSQLELGQILDYHKQGLSWAQIPPKLQLDLTGEEALQAALNFL